MELVLLQVGLVLLAAYFALGVVAPKAYAWPLLVGPGPFFVVLCLYLTTQLQRRAPHLYGLVRFTTVYSIPYAAVALARGRLMTGQGFTIGDLPPILLGITLLLRLRAWRRLFDAPPSKEIEPHRALLVELFAGVGSCSFVMGLVAQVPGVAARARSIGERELISASMYLFSLVRLMTFPALVAAMIGWGIFRSRGTTPWLRAALAYVVVMILAHGGLTLVFAKDVWSLLSALVWTLVLIAFGAWIRSWYQKRPAVPVPGAPHTS